MSTRYLFNSDGHYVAFVYNGNVFTPDADWIGFVRNGNEIYSTDGSFMGFILDDDRVARRRDQMSKTRLLSPLCPLSPLRPLRPLKRLRMPRLPYPWEDVFAKGVMGVQLSHETVQSFDELENSDLIAADGTFLGRVTQNAYDPDSLANEFGYGNPFNPKTIFNEFGTYGNPFNSLSPFNEFTRTPPRFVRDGKIIAYLTANEFVSPRIEPRAFIKWLKRNAA